MEYDYVYTMKSISVNQRRVRQVEGRQYPTKDMNEVVSECVTVTDEPFDATCIYDGEDIGNHAVELTSANEDGLWITIAIRNVDVVREALVSEGAIETPTGSLREGHSYEDLSCLWCGETIDGHGVVLEQRQRLGIHARCCEPVAQQLALVWSAADSLLAEQLG